jgi:hypothetical protein
MAAPQTHVNGCFFGWSDSVITWIRRPQALQALQAQMPAVGFGWIFWTCLASFSSASGEARRSLMKPASNKE